MMLYYNFYEIHIKYKITIVTLQINDIKYDTILKKQIS